ncbi:methicillin resistance protein [Tersicoccus phoenicis]|uniref:Methicillin resistance protein n=1 Tax=Tersicoccus phoenicis TaxID=554083 RepID=A0A1R1LAI1_9MICC|nr:peptidoglycan bridge formation glycyltransferase FemA/FemB family protein [Tersicoccus phoenicis]OMH24551.1 methicillin resistance protein [Tersicoccus phoenicis]
MPAFTARFASDGEIARWDELVLANPGGGNLLQSEAFIDVKKRYGWTPRYLVLESGETTVACLALEKTFPVLGTLWYLIKGPDVGDAAAVIDALDAVKELVRRERLRVFAVKIEPDLVDDERSRALFSRAGLVKTFNIQPNDSTAVLDVAPDERQLLRTLHSRGRNAIRRAQREGVEVVRMPADEDTYRQMFAMMGQVGQGKANVALRSYDYYRRFWQNFADRGQGRMYFVFEDGAPAVGAFVINYGHKGTYKDGGSIPRRKAYGDSHLVQWTAINDLKAEGVTSYDFCGTPPSDRLKDTSHPHHGLGLFKTSFTKTVVDYVGCWDLVINPVAYRAWSSIGERAFRQLWWRRHRQPFY